MKCRFCNKELEHQFIDLVNSPPSNSYLKKEQLNEPEIYFPLRLFVCDSCFLVQIDEYKKSSEIFGASYLYYSSFSSSWLAHCKKYCDMIIGRQNLDKDSLVMEIASNDGYLLQYFKEQQIPVLGVEPTDTADAAMEKGIDVEKCFFNTESSEKIRNKQGQADLIIGNNVLAHVPDINDFVNAMKNILKPDGIITMEFPHLYELVKNNQFDTIYHEHFSYLSLYSVTRIFKEAGLKVYNVDQLSTHGGSLRIYASHEGNEKYQVSSDYKKIADLEAAAGMKNLDFYLGFQIKADKVKLDFTDFIVNSARENKKVAAYGAAAKGNTLLNYCGIKNDIISFVVDASVHKQNHYLPGSHIPIVAEADIKKYRPDYIIIFPWNIKEEVMNQLDYVRQWDAKFVVAVPELTIL